MRNMRRFISLNAALLFLTLAPAFLLSACAQSAYLSPLLLAPAPPSAASALAPSSRSAAETTPPPAVSLFAAPAQEESLACTYAMPIRVIITNHSAEAVRIKLEDFALQLGDVQTLQPLPLQAIVQMSSAESITTPHSIQWAAYTGMRAIGRPRRFPMFPYRYGPFWPYGAYQYGPAFPYSWPSMEQPYRRELLLSRALKEGELLAGQTLTGVLFFPLFELNPEQPPALTLQWKSPELPAVVKIPLEIHYQ